MCRIHVLSLVRISSLGIKDIRGSWTQASHPQVRGPGPPATWASGHATLAAASAVPELGFLSINRDQRSERTHRWQPIRRIDGAVHKTLTYLLHCYGRVSSRTCEWACPGMFTITMDICGNEWYTGYVEELVQFDNCYRIVCENQYRWRGGSINRKS